MFFFELGLALAAIVMLTKIAFAEEGSPIVWGGISFVAVLGSFLIPIPMFRIGIACIVVIALIIARKVAMRGR